MDLIVTTDGEQSDRRLGKTLKVNRLRALRPRGSSEPPSDAVRLAFFNGLDADKNGALSEDEVPERYRRLHGYLDVDEDGGVTADELKPAMWLIMRR